MILGVNVPLSGGRPVLGVGPGWAPRAVLRLSAEPLTGERRAGEGTLDQVLGDLDRLRAMGAGSVVLDPLLDHPDETLRPERAWQDLATVAAHRVAAHRKELA
ncbi:hypothetical protein [Actinomadura harenae]|uniref:Uncharacterized protein n=1 Tax=Actinomadura harenae TaxID=2483351 RepID=A0A3M2LV37_9ACTN|nr:hypothetical protein [Actinomadura harenae]RMI40966.1 hypothetical protein EBO15_24435 [Actinomadura harenae]